MHCSVPGDIGPTIPIVRESLDLLVREISSRIELSINAVNPIERGDDSPNLESSPQIAEGLCVSTTEFFTDKAQQTLVYVQPADQILSQYETMQIESLESDLRNQQIEPYKITLPPGHSVNATRYVTILKDMPA